MKNDPLIFIEDDDPPSPTLREDRWWILIVDDDADVHKATDLALRDLVIEGKPLHLLFAKSAAEAVQHIAAHEDIAVILLDVVMETDDAGLQLVKQIREVWQRKLLRIILRTGQPGYAPELESIRDYDINDYRSKSELTRIRLLTSLTTAVRAYKQMREHDELLKGFERLLRASAVLMQIHESQPFARSAFQQLARVLHVPVSGLVCEQERVDVDDPEWLLPEAHGAWHRWAGHVLSDVPNTRLKERIHLALAQDAPVWRDHMLVLPVSFEGAPSWVFCLEMGRAPTQVDQQLVKLFLVQCQAGLANTSLYAKLVNQAYVDPLLRLPNLNSLLKLLEDESQSHQMKHLALVDIDDFSALVDAFGHEFGDSLLMAMGDQLQRGLVGAHISRLGPDIFGILGSADVVTPARVKQCLAQPGWVPGKGLMVSVTMGLVRVHPRKDGGSRILKDAQVALKHAKKNHRGEAAYFSNELGADARERMQLLSSLRHAFDAQHMYMQYQPKVSLETGQPTGLEALVRWRRSDGSMVSPELFVPLAEQSGLMVALGTFILRSACLQLARLRQAGETSLVMSVNVSQAQLREPGFLTALTQAIDNAQVPAQFIELELTETMASDDAKLLKPLLMQIQALGVSVAMDDFGTGFSSLSVLKNLPLQRLKIDKSFVRELETDDSIARMVITLGRTLGMQITAEGVETPAQHEILKALGCHEGQGWLYARALDEAALLDWLKSKRPKAHLESNPQ